MFEQASEIVQVILDHGKLRSPDILLHLGVYEPKSEPFYISLSIDH